MLFGIFFLLLAFVLVILGLAYQEVSRWLYPPDIIFPDQTIVPEFMQVTLQTADDLTIVGWYAPPKNGYAILMLHGHSGNRYQLLPHADYLLPEGFGILSIDFRNHGDSAGERTSLGVHELKDAQAAYDFLMARDDVEGVILFGHSMGGAVATRLMQDVDAAGLIITSTFADFPSTVSAGVIARGLPERSVTTILLTMYSILSGADWTAIYPEVHIADINKPILLMHGTDDFVIPIDHAYRLADVNEQVRLEVFEGGAHSNLYEVDPDRYRLLVLDYLTRIMG